MATIPQLINRPSIIQGDIAKIPLGVDAKDGYAIVDKEYSWLDKYKWSLSKMGYAFNAKHGLMHHHICGKPQSNMVTDHINRDKLDNRATNLRHITQHQNSFNTKHSINNKSGYRGVSQHVLRGKHLGWRAAIHLNGKRIHGGIFQDKIEAAKRYNEMALQYHGEHGVLNELS